MGLEQCDIDPHRTTPQSQEQASKSANQKEKKKEFRGKQRITQSDKQHEP